VLWETGFIDETSIEKYKLTGKNDDFGIVDNSTSLRHHMMTMCSDFLHEQGKCHAELLAGKGVECMWACSKNRYRNLSLKEKKGKDKFTEAVRKCFDGRCDYIDANKKICKTSKTIFDCLVPCN